MGACACDNKGSRNFHHKDGATSYLLTIVTLYADANLSLLVTDWVGHEGDWMHEGDCTESENVFRSPK